MQLSDLIEMQRRFDHDRATTFEWSAPISEDHPHPLIHNVLALAGEAGEIANLTKKFDRGDFPFETLMDELPGELADVLLYVVKIAYQSNIDLEAAVLAKMTQNASRFPRASALIEGDELRGNLLIAEADKRAAAMSTEDEIELRALYLAEGVTPPSRLSDLVAGALLVLGVAQLYELEGNPTIRASKWLQLAPVAEEVNLSYDSLVRLTKHDTRMERLLSPHRDPADAA